MKGTDAQSSNRGWKGIAVGKFVKPSSKMGTGGAGRSVVDGRSLCQAGGVTCVRNAASPGEYGTHAPRPRRAQTERRTGAGDA
jgi:hypothetical protein